MGDFLILGTSPLEEQNQSLKICVVTQALLFALQNTGKWFMSLDLKARGLSDL